MASGRKSLRERAREGLEKWKADQSHTGTHSFNNWKSQGFFNTVRANAAEKGDKVVDHADRVVNTVGNVKEDVRNGVVNAKDTVMNADIAALPGKAMKHAGKGILNGGKLAGKGLMVGAAAGARGIANLVKGKDPKNMTYAEWKTAEKKKDAREKRMRYIADKGTLITMFWVTLFIHIMFVIGSAADSRLINFSNQVLLFSVYTMLAILMWIVFDVFPNWNNKPLGGIRNLIIYFGIAAFYVMLPEIVNLLFMDINMVIPPIMGQTTLKDLFVLLMILFPVLPILIAFHPETPSVYRTITLLWMLFIIVMTMIGVLSSLGEQLPLDEDAGDVDTRTPWQKWLDDVGKKFEEQKNAIIGGPTRAIEELYNATLPNYQSNIDRNTQRPLGVHIKDIEPAYQNFIAPYDSGGYVRGEDVQVYAVIAASTLESTNEYEVDLSCTMEIDAQRGHRYVVQGTISPDSVLLGDDEEYDVLCEIDKEGIKEVMVAYFQETQNPLDLTKGVRSVVYINASFPFKTWAYLTYVFIDKQQKNQRTKAGEDLNDQFDIPREPSAIYTKGPVRIGIKTKPQPYPLSATRPILPDFGVSLENDWRGKGYIEHVDFVRLYIPDQLRFKSLFEYNKGDSVEVREGAQAEDIPSHWTYILDNINIRGDYFTARFDMFFEEEIGLIDAGEGRYFEQFDLSEFQYKEIVSQFLGPGGISAHTFMAEANYRFQVGESETIRFVSRVGDDHGLI